MVFRYVHIGPDITAKIFTRGDEFFAWARDFPICNLKQYLARRTRRWQSLLEDAGWSAAEAAASTSTSAAAARKQLRGSPDQLCNWSSEEQEVRLDALLFLLLHTSQRRSQAQGPEAGHTLAAIGADLQGELDIGVATLAACSVQQGIVDVQILHTMAAQLPNVDPCIIVLSRDIGPAARVSFADFSAAMYRAGMAKQWCQGASRLWATSLQLRWAELPVDPLFAGVQAPLGPSQRRARRLDPDLREVLAEVASRGGARTMDLVERAAQKKIAGMTATRTWSTLVQGVVARAMHCYGAAATKGVPRLSLAADASRVSGEKTLVSFAVWPGNQASLWLAPQIVRDFATQLNQSEDAVADEATVLRWECGMRLFFCNFDRTAWQQSEEQADGGLEATEETAGGRAPEETDKIPRLARLSSYDLLVALDNALRSCHLSLRHFASGPQPLPGPLLTLSLDQVCATRIFYFEDEIHCI